MATKPVPNLHGLFDSFPKGPKPKTAKKAPKIQDPQVEDSDPFGNFYFALEVNNIEVAHFMECSGLKTSTEVFEIEEGGFNSGSHKRPGQSQWDNITLRYATSASTFLLEWRDKFLMDQFEERTKYSGSIALMNNAGQVVRRYHFENAWPVSWEGPSLNGGGSELAIEALEIAHDGLTIKEDEWKAKRA